MPKAKSAKGQTQEEKKRASSIDEIKVIRYMLRCTMKKLVYMMESAEKMCIQEV